MAEQEIQQNYNFVENIWDASLKKYREGNTTLGKDTRTSEGIKTDEILETQKPFFSSIMNSMFCHNNAEIMKMMEIVMRRVMREENQGIKTSINTKLIDLTIENDRLDSLNRQDNLIVVGYEEPAKNYDQYGRD